MLILRTGSEANSTVAFEPVAPEQGTFRSQSVPCLQATMSPRHSVRGQWRGGGLYSGTDSRVSALRTNAWDRRLSSVAEWTLAWAFARYVRTYERCQVCLALFSECLRRWYCIMLYLFWILSIVWSTDRHPARSTGSNRISALLTRRRRKICLSKLESLGLIEKHYSADEVG